CCIATPWHLSRPAHRHTVQHSTAGPAACRTYPLPLHDALPILLDTGCHTVESARHSFGKDNPVVAAFAYGATLHHQDKTTGEDRSEEHTSELQSRENLVCRLLLEKKKTPTPPPVPAASAPRHAL